MSQPQRSWLANQRIKVYIPLSLPNLEAKDDDDGCIMIAPQTQPLPLVKPLAVCQNLGSGSIGLKTVVFDNIIADMLTKIGKVNNASERLKTLIMIGRTGSHSQSPQNPNTISAISNGASPSPVVTIPPRGHICPEQVYPTQVPSHCQPGHGHIWRSLSQFYYLRYTENFAALGKRQQDMVAATNSHVAIKT